MAKFQVTITGEYEIPDSLLEEFYGLVDYMEAARIDQKVFEADPMDAIAAMDVAPAVRVKVIDA